VELGRGPEGKRRRKSTFLHTEADAITTLKKLHARMVGGHMLATSTPTVAKFLEDWFATNNDTWQPSTRRSYRGSIDTLTLVRTRPVPTRNAEGVVLIDVAVRLE
jgi:hypothetical protein